VTFVDNVQPTASGIARGLQQPGNVPQTRVVEAFAGEDPGFGPSPFFNAGKGTPDDPYWNMAGTAYDKQNKVRGALTPEFLMESVPVGSYVRTPEGEVVRRDISGFEAVGNTAVRGLDAAMRAPGNIADTAQLDILNSLKGTIPRQLPGMTPASPRPNYDEQTVEPALSLAQRGAKQQAVAAQFPQSVAVQDFMASQSFSDGLKAIGADPLEIIGTIGAESAFQMAPALVVAAATRNPQLMAAAMGGNSAAVEYANGILSYYATKNLGPGDIANNPQFMDDAIAFAKTRAAVVGGTDWLTGLVAPKLVRPGAPWQTMGLETAFGAAAGGTGEAAGQVATGQEINPADILAEIAGETIETPLSVARQVYDNRTAPPVDTAGQNAGALLQALQGMNPNAGSQNVAPAAAPPEAQGLLAEINRAKEALNTERQTADTLRQEASQPAPAAPQAPIATAVPATAGDGGVDYEAERQAAFAEYEAANTPEARAVATQKIAQIDIAEEQAANQPAAQAAQQEQQSVQAETEEGAGQEIVQEGQGGGQGYSGIPGQAEANVQEVTVIGDRVAHESPIGVAAANVISQMEDKPKLAVWSSEETVPSELIQRAGLTGDGQTEAFYDSTTDTVHIIAGNIDNADRADWVGTHEVGHALLRSALKRKGTGVAAELMKTAENPTVAAIMTAMTEQRGETGPMAAEETLVELLTAHHTGGWDHIEDRYGIEVPMSVRKGADTFVKRAIEAIKKWLSQITGGKRYSDNDVYQILELFHAERKGTRTNSQNKAAVEDGVAASKKSPKPTANQKARAAVGKAAKDLTETELSELSVKTADKLVSTLKQLPSEKDFAAIGWAGRAKRGWYARSVNAISDIFGADGPRFAALLAATSPQISVEGNLENALSIWKTWIAEGRPTSDIDIRDIMRRSVRQGAAGTTGSSVLGAWENNSVEALSAIDPSKIVLSGPKVDSFMRNLIGDVNEVTNDAWMARFANVDAKVFAGVGRKVDGDKKGRKGAGYLAMNVLVRRAARILSEYTGEVWTPAEVQETIWSWGKTLQDMATGNNKAFGKSDGRNETELLLDNELTDALIASTPDFGTLFSEGKYADILGEAGYADQVESLRATRQRDEGQAGEEPAAGRQAGPLAEEDQKRRERAASERLRLSRGQTTEQGLKRERRDRRVNEQAADAAENRLAVEESERSRLDNERASAPGEYDDEVPFSKKPGKNVYGDKQGRDLEGLPKTVTIKGQGPVEFHGYLPAQEIASRFAAKWGSSLPTAYVKVDEARAERIAAAYDAMPHSPTSQATSMAYQAMIDETLEQYEAMLEAGVEIHFISEDAHHHGPDGGKGDPYQASPRLAIMDVVENNRLYVFPTTSGFGDNNGEEAFPGNPLLQPTKYKIDGIPAVANDIFRAVHDYFGHVANGVGFRADGEENAWREHAAMYSPLARRAMTTETRGQNSWVNYGPKGAQNRTASSAETVFADQKAGLLPRWVSEDGATDNAIAIEEPMPDVVFKKGDTAVYNAAVRPMEPIGRFGGKMEYTGPKQGERVTVNFYDSHEGLTNVGVPHRYSVTKADGKPATVWASDLHSPEGGYEANKNKPAVINVGLDIPGGGTLEEARVLSELKSAGANVTSSDIFPSATEPTLVANVSKPIPLDALHSLSVALEQEAVPQRYADGTGDLAGPSAAKWGDFREESFTMDDGKNPLGNAPRSVKPTEPKPTTGIRRDDVTAEREARGEAELIAYLHTTNAEANAEAAAILTANPGAGRALAAEILANPRTLTPAESFVLARDRLRINYNVQRHTAQVAGAVKAGNEAREVTARMALTGSLQELEMNDRAASISGTASGQSLQAHAARVAEDYNEANVMNRAVVAADRALESTEKKTLREQAAKIKELEAKLVEKQAADREAKAQTKRVAADPKAKAMADFNKWANVFTEETKDNPRGHCKI
jgi:hypothetical protein